MATPHILVIDDDLDTLVLIQMVLEEQGYRVTQAADAAQGWALAGREMPDLILLDVMMPGEDGFSLARRLRSDPRFSNIPILMFTAKGLLDDKATGYQAGADDYLTKPVHPTDLLARVRGLLSRYGAGDEAPALKPQQLVVCLGATPGAGTTSVAASLAAAFAAGGQRVIAVGPLCGIGVDGLSTLFAGREALTAERLGAALVPLAGGAHALPGPAGALHEPQFRPVDVTALVSALAALADAAIFDLGAAPAAFNRQLISLADDLLLVAAPTHESLASADQVLRSLRAAGVVEGRVSAVLVRQRDDGPAVNAPVIKEGLGAAQVVTIPAVTAPSGAAASGEPLLAVEPGSATAEAYSHLAASLVHGTEVH